MSRRVLCLLVPLAATACAALESWDGFAGDGGPEPVEAGVAAPPPDGSHEPAASGDARTEVPDASGGESIDAADAAVADADAGSDARHDPTFVQANAVTGDALPVPSLLIPIKLAQTPGSLNVVAVGWYDDQVQVAVTDTLGNPYTLAIGPTVSPGVTKVVQSIYYAPGIKGASAGQNVVNVNFSKATTYSSVRVAEYAGLDPSQPFDTAVQATGLDLAPATPPATTRFPVELVVAAGTANSPFTGTDPTFTLRASARDGILEDRNVTATGSYTTSAKLLLRNNWVMQVATFH